MSFTGHLLSIARSQVGVREVGTSNTGPEVNAYLAAAGLPPGNPWCAAFVRWVTSRACDEYCVANPLPHSGYCPDFAAFAKAHGLLFADPQPGDVFLRYEAVDGAVRAAHTGFVAGVDGGSFTTHEGNTNDTGSRSGVGVFSLRRQTAGGYKFLRLPAAVPLWRVVSAGGLGVEAILDGDTTIVEVAGWAGALGVPEPRLVGGNVCLGASVGPPVKTLDGRAWCPLRACAAATGLKVLGRDAVARTVTVGR